MVKYIAAALSLKVFSCTPLMRRLYRGLANQIGGRRRQTGRMTVNYRDRVKHLIRLSRQYRIVRDGDRILELGTGWLHWEAITLRLFFDVSAVLYDVWDNRQLGAMKNYVRQLGDVLDDGFGLSPTELQRARSLIDQILQVESFEDLYRLLNFEYVVESSGSLGRFQDDSFDLVLSATVLEHVSREALPTFIHETYRILKRGGWAVHGIDISDHLAYYDATVSKKRYLCISDATWRLLYDNNIQGINRVQCDEWLELFKACGFELLDKELWEVDISGLKIAPRFSSMDPRDLAIAGVRLTLKKRP